MTKEQIRTIFDPFKPTCDKTTEMLKATQKLCWEMCSPAAPARWLSLIGPSGTGKTMLARLASKFFNRHMTSLTDENQSGSAAMFFRKGGLLQWPKCIEWMLDSDFGFYPQACDDWFLALDDIGAENKNLAELSLSKLYTILSARQHKWTILTCNFTLEQISERLDPRIASRLIRHGGIVIDSTGAKDFNA